MLHYRIVILHAEIHLCFFSVYIYIYIYIYDVKDDTTAFSLKVTLNRPKRVAESCLYILLSIYIFIYLFIYLFL